MKRLAISLMLSLASCGERGAPEIMVQDAWARPTLTPAQPAAVYLNMVNKGRADDRLEGVTSERGRASIHNSVVENGVASMRPVTEGVVVAAGSTVALQPNGMHIMLEGVGEPLKAGSHLPLTLKFAKSGNRQLRVTVADAPSETHGGHR